MRKWSLLVSSILFASCAFAQSTLDIEIKGAPGFEHNIFNAPEDYVRPAGDTLTVDSLLKDDLFFYFNADFDFEWEKDAHRIEWANEVELLRYREVEQANATEIQSELSYAHRPDEGFEKGGSFRIRSQDRLGLNVLGSELLTPFSFRQYEVNGFIGKEKKDKRESVLTASYSYKDYDICFGCDLQGRDVSLTQGEWDIEFEQMFVTGENAGKDQELELSVRWRNRNYRDWINYELLDPNPDPLAEEPFLAFDPDFVYQPRQWRYLIFKGDYTFPLSRDAKVKPVIEYTRRFDVSNGDFSYVQWQPAVYFYLHGDDWDIRVYTSYTSRNYTDRLARQQEGVPFPNLEYRYLRASTTIERELGSGFAVWVEANYANRNSNTTLINTRVRRSYENWQVMGGLRWAVKYNRSEQLKLRKSKFEA